MLTVSGVSKSFNDHELFSGVSFTVGMSDRIAVIGRNGTGKTTLFEIMTGNIIPDSGSVSARRDTAIGYLRQDVQPSSERSLLEYVSGSAYAYGAGSNNNNLEFQIVNTSATDPATINSLTATYTASPVSYYGEITWDGTIIWSNGTHNGSGDIAGFSDQNINAGQTVTIQLVDFRQNQGGSGLKIDVNGVSFIISFSNGDTINFMVP